MYMLYILLIIPVHLRRLFLLNNYILSKYINCIKKKPLTGSFFLMRPSSALIKSLLKSPNSNSNKVYSTQKGEKIIAFCVELSVFF